MHLCWYRHPGAGASSQNIARPPENERADRTEGTEIQMRRSDSAAWGPVQRCRLVRLRNRLAAHHDLTDRQTFGAARNILSNRQSSPRLGGGKCRENGTDLPANRRK